MRNDHNYWNKRTQLAYYRSARKIIRSVKADSILDVGGWDTPVPLWCPGTGPKVSLNLRRLDGGERWDGIDYAAGNFLTWEAPHPFDLVTCLQVLEHIPNPDVVPFTRKLFQIARKAVVISVPYQWPKNCCRHHCQDPVTHEKLCSWTERTPDTFTIDTDHGHQRLVGLYRLDS